MRSEKTEGIHHITAIVGHPQENVDFYAGVLGLRLVKKTRILMIRAHTIYILEMKAALQGQLLRFSLGRGHKKVKLVQGKWA